MGHNHHPEAEKILDRKYPVLDKGFVCLIDYMGSDDRIVQAARVSYGQGTKTKQKDKSLIYYLMENDHTSPFEQVVLTFHIKLPIFVARQWIRHRTGRINEISGRYSILDDEFYIPAHDDVAFQSTDNKQGRSDEFVSDETKREFRESLQKTQELLYAEYRNMIENGIARELARINLPLSIYTEWYWQMDLHNLFHFIKLRLDRHAQKEIREYAEVIFQLTEKVCPVACEAFRNLKMKGVTFSEREMDALRNIIAGKDHSLSGRDAEKFILKLNI